MYRRNESSFDESKMPVSVKEARGFEVCSHCFMQLATVRLYGFNGLIQPATIGRKDGILQNKKRYPSGLVSDKAPHHSMVPAASNFALPRLAMMG